MAQPETRWRSLYLRLALIPAVAFPAALVADLLFYATRSPLWYGVGTGCLALGLVGGAAAAVPGMGYFWRGVPRTESRESKYATAHMALGVALWVVLLLSLLLRTVIGPRDEGTLRLGSYLTVVGNLELWVAAWLGAHLIRHRRRMRVTMLDEAEERLRR